MEKIITVAVSLMALCACEHKILYDVTYNVVLDSSNEYLAGSPVKFKITGDVDNLLFFSGEPGHEYQFRNRHEVSLSDINAVEMSVQYQPRWGSPGGLDVYVSNTFQGLDGADGEADRATIRAMVDGGMTGWTKLEYVDGEAQSWATHTYDIAPYMENFSVAFHWHPEYTGTYAQRTYWLNGIIRQSFPGAESTQTFKDLDFVSVIMNEQLDPYLHVGNGSVIIGGYQSEINFQGAGGQELDFALNAWCISKPTALNKVSHDNGSVIKNMENYLDSYQYVYSEPGCYSATFVGVNDNVGGVSEKVKQLNIVIL